MKATGDQRYATGANQGGSHNRRDMNGCPGSCAALPLPRRRRAPLPIVNQGQHIKRPRARLNHKRNKRPCRLRLTDVRRPTSCAAQPIGVPAAERLIFSRVCPAERRAATPQPPLPQLTSPHCAHFLLPIHAAAAGRLPRGLEALTNTLRLSRRSRVSGTGGL